MRVDHLMGGGIVTDEVHNIHKVSTNLPLKGISYLIPESQLVRVSQSYLRNLTLQVISDRHHFTLHLKTGYLPGFFCMFMN